MDDEDRDAILRRRNRFMSLALAGIATVGCDDVLPAPCLEAPVVEPSPLPCLSPVTPDMQDPPTMEEVATMDEVAPQPCLEPPLQENELTDEVEPVARPRPCLSRVRPRPERRPVSPQPCLSAVNPDLVDPVQKPGSGET